MTRFILAAVCLAAVGTACDRPAPAPTSATPAPTPAAAAPTEAGSHSAVTPTEQPQAPVASAKTPTPTPKASAVVPAAAPPTPTPAPTPAPVAPAPAVVAAKAAPTLGAATPSAEYLVWNDGITEWIADGGDTNSVIASRSEVVVSDGARLWVAETTSHGFERRGCCVIDAPETCTAEDRSTDALPGLKLRGLADAPDRVVFVPKVSDYEVGDIDGAEVTLEGSFGANVFASRSISYFGCGAHGMIDAWSYAFDGAAGRELALTPAAYKRIKAVQRKAQPALRAILLEAEGEDPPEGELSGALVNFSLQAGSGKPHGRYQFAVDVIWPATDAAWSGYTASTFVKGGSIAALGMPASFPDAVRRAVAEQTGPFGFAEITAKGPARDALLAAFRAPVSPAPTKPAPTPAVSTKPAGAEAGHIARGRKLTRSKAYADAVAAFDAAIAANKAAHRAWSGRGFARLGKGDLPGAKADFEHALTLNSGKRFQASVWFNLGVVAAKQGDKTAANKAWQTSHTLRPSKATAKKLGLPVP